MLYQSSPSSVFPASELVQSEAKGKLSLDNYKKSQHVWHWFCKFLYFLFIEAKSLSERKILMSPGMKEQKHLS